MQHTRVSFETDFDVVLQNARAQAAVMVLDAGETTGGPHNRHRTSDQWLFVLSGSGTAVVEGKQLPLGPGTLLLIEKGEVHEIRSEGDGRLETINVYVPPEY